jgi:uncharacterized membrane protein YphA (DoxX/SURF4 family)
METTTPTPPASKAMFWIGWILSILPCLMLLMSGVMKLVPDAIKEGFEKLGYDYDLALGLGIVEITCTIIYLVPRTSVLGAILLTGYLGGAVATHVRVHDVFIAPIILGVVLWAGLWLRDTRLRALVPWRS